MPTSNPLRSYKGPASLLGRIFYMQSFNKHITGFNDKDFHDNRFDLFRHKMFQGKLWEMAFSTTYLGGNSSDPEGNEERRVIHKLLNSTEVLDKDERINTFRQASREYAKFRGTDKKWYEFFASTANPLKKVEWFINFLEEALMAGARLGIRSDGKLPGWLMGLYFILALSLRSVRFVVYSITGMAHYAKEHPIIFGLTALASFGVLLTCIFFPPAAGFLLSAPALAHFLTTATPWMLASLVTGSLLGAAMIGAMASQLCEGILNFGHDLKLIATDKKLLKKSSLIYAALALTTLIFMSLCIFFPPLSVLIFTHPAMVTPLAKTGFFLLGIVVALMTTDALMTLPSIGRYLLKGPRQWLKDIKAVGNNLTQWISTKFVRKTQEPEDKELDAFAATKKRLEVAKDAAEFSTHLVVTSPAANTSINNDDSVSSSSTHSRRSSGAPDFERHLVEADGNCGYTAFGITRADAYTLARGPRLNEIVNILQPAIQEQLLNQDFIDYLRQTEQAPGSLFQAFNQYKQAADQGGEIDAGILQALYNHGHNLSIVNAYLTYDIQEKRIDDGWSHPCMLQALAHLQGIGLNIWQPNAQGQYVPHQYFPHYQPIGANQQTNLLFVNGNHFERLEQRQNIIAPPIVEKDVQVVQAIAKPQSRPPSPDHKMLDIMFESQPLLPDPVRGRSNTLRLSFFNHGQENEKSAPMRGRATTIVGTVSDWFQNIMPPQPQPQPQPQQEQQQPSDISSSRSSVVIESPSSQSSSAKGSSSSSSGQPSVGTDDEALGDIHYLFDSAATTRRVNHNYDDKVRSASTSRRAIPKDIVKNTASLYQK